MLRHQQHVTVCLLGSALKGLGIQPLLDGIIDYLPSPSQRPPLKCVKSGLERSADEKGNLLVFCFKNISDKARGELYFCRVFAGVLRKNITLSVSGSETSLKIVKIYRVQAEHFEEIKEATAGDIVALLLEKPISSGDSLVSLAEGEFHVGQIQFRAPVYFTSIEALQAKQQQELNKEVHRYAKEDNTLTVKDDAHSGQLQVGARGELQIEVLIDRIKEERGIVCRAGKIAIAFY